MAASATPSLIQFYPATGQNYQLIERARVLRVLFETGSFNAATARRQGVAQLSAAALDGLLGGFLPTPIGPPPGIDPIAGLPTPAPQWKLDVVTEVSQRRIQVPWVSLDPCIQFVPQENDYVLVLFLGGMQGVAMGYYEHPDTTGSFRQGRLALQRGDVAIVARNKLRPNTTALVLTSGGTAKLAANDGNAILMTSFDDRRSEVFRNLLQQSGVHRLKIEENRFKPTRPGIYDLEVYEQSILRSANAATELGRRAAGLLAGNICVVRMGSTRYERGVAIVDPLAFNTDVMFQGVYEDLVGVLDPSVVATRRLKSYFVINRSGDFEVNAGNYSPVEIPTPSEGVIPEPLPPDDLPSTIADLKLRSSGDTLIQALGDLIQQIVGKVDQVSLDEQRFKALSFKFQAGVGPTGLGGIEISEAGSILLYLGTDPETALTKIEIDAITQTITIKSPLLAIVDVPILQLGLLVPTTIRAGLTGGNIIYDPVGGITINAVGGGSVTVNAAGAGKIFLGGAGKAVMLDSIIAKFNGHSHSGVTPGGGSTGGPSATFDSTDSSDKVESID